MYIIYFHDPVVVCVCVCVCTQVLGILIIFECVTPEDSLRGFGNTGVATVCILFIVAAGVTRTNTLATFFRYILGNKPPRDLRIALLHSIGGFVSLSEQHSYLCYGCSSDHAVVPKSWHRPLQGSYASLNIYHSGRYHFGNRYLHQLGCLRPRRG